MDESEHISVVTGKQFPQMGTTLGMAFIPFCIAHRPGIFKGFGDLYVQFHAVRYYDEGPVARMLPKNLLGKKDHGKTLPAPLCLPENTPPAVA